MIIGLHGRARSGKDTAFKFIHEVAPHAERVGFADMLKDSAAALLGVDREFLEKWKDQHEVKLVFHETKGNPYDGYTHYIWPDLEMTGRQFLQRYGTEAHRDIFGSNFWVDQVLPPTFDHEDRLIVITDVRFPNEQNRIHELGGTVWHIDRPEVEKGDTHASEAILFVDRELDYIIPNHGDLDEFRWIVQHEYLTQSGLETFIGGSYSQAAWIDNVPALDLGYRING